MLALAAVAFTRLGAEFVPQLDEGDVLVEARRLPGVALSESVATDARMQKAILRVPEVMHVVSKTGAPELATDPMGMEQTDVYIALKDRAAWRDGITKEDIGKQNLRGIGGGGARGRRRQSRSQSKCAPTSSSLASNPTWPRWCTGRDLDELTRAADEVARVLRRIPGAEDVRVEQVAGLRYLKVDPDRQKLARYGLTIADVNQLTETMSVGHKVGDVLEGERRFGIAVKVAHGYDGDLSALLSLPLRALSGQVVPLGDVAKLSFASGPAQISRDSQSRRISVEFNVRGRDLLSVVKDAQAAAAQVKLPTGYRIEWGGQFHHYEEARQRLSLVVPLALLLIGFLLWLAFRSVRTALLIFLNVPFAIAAAPWRSGCATFRSPFRRASASSRCLASRCSMGWCSSRLRSSSSARANRRPTPSAWPRSSGSDPC